MKPSSPAKHPVIVLCLLTVTACSRDNGGPSPEPPAGGVTESTSSTEARTETSGLTVPQPNQPGSPSPTATAPSTQPQVPGPADSSSGQPSRANPEPSDSYVGPLPSGQPSESSAAVEADTSGSSDENGTASSGAAESMAAGPRLPPLQPAGAPISFGTTLNPAEVMTGARELAQTLVDVDSPNWRSKGDQHRTYRFAETNKDEPYRLYVPDSWDGQTPLPLVMFLHGSGSNENTYVDQNNKQMLDLAEQRGFILVSPLGATGAYGNFLRLSAPFGNPAAANELMAQVTPESRRSNELSERDVINVLELILAEYPINQSAMYLTGHSMGSGGTWYIGGKYSTYWRAIAPMSGPFVQEEGYPWDNLLDIGILVTEGTNTPSLDGSRLLGSWLSEQGFDAEYKEVDADHGGMVPLVLPDVFAFFANRPG